MMRTQLFLLAISAVLYSLPLTAQTIERIELTEQREINSKTFLKLNGRTEKEIYGGPIHYLENGAWYPIETTLQLSKSLEYSFSNETNILVTYFPQTIGSGSDVKLVYENNVIRFSSLKEEVIADINGNCTPSFSVTNAPAPQVSENRIYFQDVYTGFSDSYEVLQGMLKNNVIIDAVPLSISGMTSGYYGFSERMDLPTGWQLKPVEQSTGFLHHCAIQIVDENDVVKLIIPAPEYFDVASESTDGSSPHEGAFKIEHDASGWKLTTLVPVNWFLAPERIYPVTIDPSVTLPGFAGGWQSPVNFVNNNGFVFIGVCCSNGIHRAWVKYDISSIPDNSCITDVQLSIYVNGVGASTAELTHFYNGTDVTGMFGPYSGIIPAVFNDLGDRYYASMTITGTGTYPYLDLGPDADVDVQSQLVSNWFEVGMIFDNEPSVNWKRLTGNLCNLRVEYQAPPCVVLPVEFTDYEVNCVGDRASLSWKTVSEANNDYFTIWRSEDGTNFKEVGTVQGHGTTNEEHTYTWRSEVWEENVSYYKVSQTDFNGATEFFETEVYTNCHELVPEVFVSHDNVIVSGKDITKVVISDFTGREIIYLSNEQRENELLIDMHESKGAFLVSVHHTNGVIYTQKIMK